MKKTILALGLTSIFLTGCSGMNTTEQRTLSGGAIGAAAGAGIVAIAGANPIWGAIGGAAVGAVGGYAYDAYEKHENKIKEQAYQNGYNNGVQSSNN